MDSQRLREIFEKQGTFAIVVGQNYTVDEMASALSVYLNLKSNGRDVSIVSSKQPTVEVSSLVGIDTVKPNFESTSGDLIVSFPYQQDEIGKVSYTLENGLLNIIVKPKDNPLSFGEKDVIFKRSGNLPEVIITLGVKRISELQAFFDVQSLKDTVIVNIDKAANNEGFGDVVIIGQGASSVSEQVASIMISLGFAMDSDMSQNLMTGIVSSTGNFQSPRTSSLAFEMAGILLRNGARRDAVRAQNPEQIRTPQQFGYNMNQRGTQSQNSAMPAMPRPQAQRPQMNQPKPQRNQSQIPPMPAMPQIDPIDQINQMQSISEFPKEQKIDDAPIDSPDAPPDWLAPKIFKGSSTVE